MVELQDEGDLVRVPARHGAEDAEGRRHRVAPALEAEAHDVLGVEVGRIRRERGAGGVLDALVYGQNRHVAGVRETPRAEQRLQARQHPRRPVRRRAAAVDEVRTRQMQVRGRNGPAAMLQQGRIVAEEAGDGVQSRRRTFDGSDSHAGILGCAAGNFKAGRRSGRCRRPRPAVRATPVSRCSRAWAGARAAPFEPGGPFAAGCSGLEVY